MEISSVLKEQVAQQKVALFLGAGASLDARDVRADRQPSALDGRGLGEKLSDRYLSGKFQDRPLHEIAEYAISESGLVDVQEYIRDEMQYLEPTEAHLLMSRFRWAGLATTNYDLLIEKAYAKSTDACQHPVAFVENGDSVDDKLQTADNVMLLKLHGCITRTRNPKCPLILATDQYITHREGRSRIFAHLKEWSYERTFIFIGHSLQDSDIRQIILEMREEGVDRRHYIVDPNMDAVRLRYWEGRKITCMRFTFLSFLQTLDELLDSPFRNLHIPQTIPRAPALKEIPDQRKDLSSACIGFLTRDVDYVRSLENIPHTTPQLFYKGNSEGWAAIEQDLDVRRRLEDQVLCDYFLDDDASQKNRPTLIVIKGHAGSGKTVLLKRLCWEASRSYERACLYLRDEGTMSVGILQEFLEALPNRLFIFVDQASKRLREIRSLFDHIGSIGAKLTVVTTERINEWNTNCQELSDLVSKEYRLGYLSESEINSLIDLLEKHKSLGALDKKSKEERQHAFKQHAGRQLLVALHEATLGRKFEDIIEDEYRGVVPFQAQSIYLTICVLNRLGVPVRAGVISRIHEVSFEDFKRDFFSPLEMVVQTHRNEILNDFVYTARHPEIAQIVFERILNTEESRFDLYARCLRGLNIDYSVDRQAVRMMIRGRSVLELFPNHEIASQILDLAISTLGSDAYVFHQSALYELHRTNGNLRRVKDLLDKAEECDSTDMSLKHSRAEYHLRCAAQASTLLEEEKHLQAALDVAHALAGLRSATAHPFHTMMKVQMGRLERYLGSISEGEASQETGVLVANAEEVLAKGLQLFPKDSYLLDAEHKLASLLKDSARALTALKDAFDTNPRNAYLAARLAKVYSEMCQSDEAVKVLKAALSANRGNTQLNFELANLLMSMHGHQDDEVEYYLHRSYSPGDGNHKARMLYGQQLYINDKITEAKSVFAELEKANAGYEDRIKPILPLEGRFSGVITRLCGTYGFIKRDGTSDSIYFNMKSTESLESTELRNGNRVSFYIAFNFKGPVAVDVKANL